MNRTQSNLLILGGVLMILAILVGVFGAHLIGEKLDPKDYENFKTANRYHRFHAVSIILLIPLGRWLKESQIRALGWIFAISVVLFSGSMYLYTTGELLFGHKQPWLASVIPFGGVGFLIGWSYFTYLGWLNIRPPEKKE